MEQLGLFLVGCLSARRRDDSGGYRTLRRYRRWQEVSAGLRYDGLWTEPAVEIRKFGTIVADLEALRDGWLVKLQSCGDGEHWLVLEARLQYFG